MQPEMTKSGEASPSSIATKTWGLLAPARRRSAIKLGLLMVVGMMLEMLGVGLVIPAIALLTQQDLAANYPIFRPVIGALGISTQQDLIIGAMLALVGIYLAKNLFLSLLAWQRTRFGYGLQAELSQRLFSLYIAQPYTFHLQRNSAQLIRNVSGEVSMLIGSAVIPGMQLVAEGLVLCGLCALLLVVEPVGTAIVVSVLGVAAWGFHRITRHRITRWGKARQYHDGMRLQHLQQGLGGAKDVKLLGRESDFLAQFGTHAVQGARVSQLQAAFLQIPGLWMELLGVMGLAALVLSMLAQGKEPASILPTLGLFAAAAFRLMPSANRILAAMQQLRFGLPVVNTLHEELKLAMPKPSHTSRCGNGAPFEHEIRLTNVSYTYHSAATPAVDRISLSIGKGESVGFIGASGSGKSTLVDVLLGLLSPQTGQITIDGQNIEQDLRAWQDQIGYVPQSIYLTDDTLRRNVAFGLPKEQIDEQAVWCAIKAAQLDEFVASLPNGLDTLVGERGIRLSGGQRQRIGIARALYHNPMVLVLDEATSALDTATEQGVMQAVTALRHSKTILIVAHRLSTVAQCDRLYRLERGALAGEGLPSEMQEIKSTDKPT
jgi:ATP-binding cassette, subfamily B, bacterial PglK